MLYEFLLANSEATLARARKRVAQRSAPVATEVELTVGLPVFLNQLVDALRLAVSSREVNHDSITTTARQHGSTLLHRGFTVAQVVHDYGDLCQVITELAVEQNAAVSTEEFRTLNLCLDDAIAGAVRQDLPGARALDPRRRDPARTNDPRRRSRAARRSRARASKSNQFGNALI